ncbi:MAG TPA: hypothetical protein VIV40_38110 [Kofleriaceae bacterium]
MLVTCPESAHLESIEYEEDDRGMVITSCTAFSPACAVTCAQMCAARLTQRRRSRELVAVAPPDEENTSTPSRR